MYAKAGAAVIKVYNPNYSDAKNLEAMIKEIENQGPRHVSKHCMTPEQYKKLNVIDIYRSQIKNPNSFIAELKKSYPNIKCIDEINNSCIHIEIPQP